MDIAVIFWLCLAVLLAVLEAVTVTLITIWFAIGAVGATIAAALGANIWIQLLVFIIISAALLIATRPLARRLLAGKREATNADRLIGAEGQVIVPIDPIDNKGQIKARGQVWSAAAADGGNIPAGETVIIEKIIGVRAIVRKKAAE